MSPSHNNLVPDQGMDVVKSRPKGAMFKYLARYTHRVAISNHRLIALQDGEVTFRFKDHKRGGKLRTQTLEAMEFLRRFMLHVLPKGLHKIRYFGFLANTR